MLVISTPVALACGVVLVPVAYALVAAGGRLLDWWCRGGHEDSR